jgi:hypothetical protein
MSTTKAARLVNVTVPLEIIVQLAEGEVLTPAAIKAELVRAIKTGTGWYYVGTNFTVVSERPIDG